MGSCRQKYQEVCFTELYITDLYLNQYEIVYSPNKYRETEGIIGTLTKWVQLWRGCRTHIEAFQEAISR